MTMKQLKLAMLTLAAAMLLLLASLGGLLLLNPRIAESWAGQPSGTPESAHAGTAKGFAFSKRLSESGVKSCLARIDDLGRGVMGGVSNFFPASNWNVDAPDSHLASVVLGQKYNNANVPFGFASLFAAPDGHGGCDGVSVQVLPSPNDCMTVRQDLLKRGKLIGDLAGVPLIQDIGSQVALVAASANTCVMVSIHIAFAAKP